MNWREITSIEELEDVHKASFEKTVVLFKHSTRCSISAASLDRLERKWDAGEMQSVLPVFLDLISHRDVSNEIADRYNVEHQSPQVLVIKEGRCIYNESHFSIDYDTVKKSSVSHTLA